MRKPAATPSPVEIVPISRLFCSPTNPRNNDAAVPHVAETQHLARTCGSRERPPRRRVDVTCPTCGAARLVVHESRRAPPAQNCRQCAAAQRRSRPRTGTTVPCLTCSTPVYRNPADTKKRFCSQKCAADGKRRYPTEVRTCWACGDQFNFTPKPRSNTSGHYCSIECRNRGYVGVVHGDPATPAACDRRAWRSQRQKFFSAGNDFCAVCGTREGRLHVHHIEGYRNVDHEDQTPLVTLCPKHHCLLEPWTRRIANLDPDRRRRAAFGILGCLGDSWAYHAGKALVAGGAR